MQLYDNLHFFGGPGGGGGGCAGRGTKLLHGCLFVMTVFFF